VSTTDDPYAKGLRRWVIAQWVVPLALFAVLAVVSVKVGAWRSNELKHTALRLGIIVAPVCVLWMILGVRDLWRARASRTWPTTSATVLSSRLYLDWWSMRNVVEIRLNFLAKEPRSPFTYHESEIFPFGYFDPLLRQYPVGATVQVHFNPADPNCVVLDPTGQDGKRKFLGGLFVAALIIGLYFLRG
jgi:hypothetical protein